MLAAGALRSPQLLMLSGIGPAADLERLGLTVALDLPGVGCGLQDHLRVPVLFRSRAVSPGAPRHWLPAAVRYLAGRGGVLASNCCEVGAFLRSRPPADRPDVQLVTHFQSERGRTLVDIEVCQLAVASRGRLALRSADPFADPLADPNYSAKAEDPTPSPPAGWARTTWRSSIRRCACEESRGCAWPTLR